MLKIPLKTFVLFLLILLISLKIFFISSSVVVVDEIAHYNAAKYILDNKADFNGKEIIPNYQFGYTPLWHLTIASLAWFLPLEIVRYVSIVITLMTTFFLYKIFKQFDKNGIIAVVTNFIPSVFVYTSGLYADGLFLMVFVSTLYFYMTKNRIWTATFMMLLLTKPYLSLAIVLPMIIISFIDKRWNQVLLAIPIAFIGFIYHIQRLTIPTLEAPSWIYYSEYFIGRSIIALNLLLPFVLYILSRPPLKKFNKFYLLMPLSALFLMILSGSIEFRWWHFASVFTMPLIYFSLNNVGIKNTGIKIATLLLVGLFVIQIFNNTLGVVGIFRNEGYVKDSIDLLKNLQNGTVLSSIPEVGIATGLLIYHYNGLKTVSDFCSAKEVDYLLLRTYDGYVPQTYLGLDLSILKDSKRLYDNNDGVAVFELNKSLRNKYCIFKESTDWLKVGSIHYSGNLITKCPDGINLENKSYSCEIKQVNLKNANEAVIGEIQSGQSLLINLNDSSESYINCVSYSQGHRCGGNNNFPYDFFIRFTYYVQK